MIESTLHLELQHLLTNEQVKCNSCISRLIESLTHQNGILKVHIPDENPGTLCLHYDSQQIHTDHVRSLVRTFGSVITTRYRHKQLVIEGMDTSDCIVVLEQGLKCLDGVLAASIQYAQQTIHIEYDSQHISMPAIQKKVRQLGYRITPGARQKWMEQNIELIFSLLAGAFTALGWLLEINSSQPGWIAMLLFMLAYIAGGWNVSRHAWSAIREKRFDTDILMVLAALGAAVLGEFAEGGLLLFLFSLGHALEERALDKARMAIKSLAQIHPKTALVRENGMEIKRPVDEISIGSIVIIKPGQRIPVDGVITTGSSTVDQSPITGESIHVEKKPGAVVFAGTINGAGSLEASVTRLARDTTLSRVITLVEEAQSKKSKTQDALDSFSEKFVPALLILVLLVVIIPPFFGLTPRESFMRAMILLVAASPCALALGAPAATLAGIARAAKGGVLVKGGIHLENLGMANTIAFDKTGTLTNGKPHLVDVISFSTSSPDEILANLAALESRSAHPLAAAIVSSAIAKSLHIPQPKDIQSITGLGIHGKIAGAVYQAGNLTMMENSGINIDGNVRESIHNLEEKGYSVIFLSKDDSLIGVATIADTIRSETKQAVQTLKNMGMDKVMMLTGDQAPVANLIAAQAGIDEIHAGLLPQEKLEIIESNLASGRKIAMVGDGVNDAPALARATIGIAMGGAGTDVALETADIVLLGNDLSRLVFAASLSRKTRRIIHQNIWIAGLVILFLVGSALAGITSIGTAVILHEGSTLIVVANALRLLNLKEPIIHA